MDAKVVVGVGNIYANESLFLAGIRPRLAAGRVSRLRCELLANAVREVLARAIRPEGRRCAISSTATGGGAISVSR